MSANISAIRCSSPTLRVAVRAADRRPARHHGLAGLSGHEELRLRPVPQIDQAFGSEAELVEGHSAALARDNWASSPTLCSVTPASNWALKSTRTRALNWKPPAGGTPKGGRVEHRTAARGIGCVGVE